MGFVGNYAPVDFHHRLTACPLYEKTIMPRGWHHDKWNHCKMIGIEYLPTTTYTVINGKDRFFFGPLARRKN